MIAATAARARERFAGLDVNTWLVSHSMGAPPKAAREALVRYHDAWANDGPEAWPAWLDEARAIADGIGALVGAAPGSVSLAPNVSVLQSAIASSLRFTPERNEVVYEALQFPSLAYVWTAWEGAGAKAVRVPTDDGRTIPTDRICSAIGDRTAVVVLSHAYYQSGVVIDVPAIVARAKEVGALVVLDTYQTTGVLPYDVVALDLDVVVGGSHKWLCGGPGCAWIYVRPAIAERFRPMVTGWMAHRDPFAFDAPPIEYATDQFRWANGTPTIPGYLVARAGHEIIRELGVASIREHNVRLTAHLTEAALERGWRVNTPHAAKDRTGWVGIDVPEAERIQAELLERRIIVDHRPGCGLRVSAHLYTTDEEIDRFLRAMDELVRR
ncbi:MAG TPA: aminotransferase class V-fold PLP-dependent enzyme [Candidatus Limnocylindria bacterium]|nr:aminotransferase class V-fold PLP-dependent enzyme [Candidatus Limnocylindria bacterium]